MNRAQELRLRRWAAKMGWRLEKSRARILHANDHGKWQLIDNRNTVRGGVNYDATLDEIEYWLKLEQKRLREE